MPEAMSSDAQETSVHPEDAGLYRQKMVCPLCNHQFEHFGVSKAASSETGHDTDLHVWYAGPNPSHYIVIVCPSCWYAAFTKDFNIVRPWEREELTAKPNLHQMMAPTWRDCDFTQPRTPIAVQQSLVLALHWYRWRGGEHLNHEAEVWLRLAWLEREVGPGHEETERVYLEKARRVLIEYYGQFQLTTTKLERRVPYLIVELSIRLGKQEEIRNWGYLLFDLRDLADRYPADTLLRERLNDLQRIRRVGGELDTASSDTTRANRR